VTRFTVQKGRRWVGVALFVCLFQVPAPAQKNLAWSVQTKLALERLNVLGSVLTIGAHRDDENAARLA